MAMKWRNSAKCLNKYDNDNKHANISIKYSLTGPLECLWTLSIVHLDYI